MEKSNLTKREIVLALWKQFGRQGDQRLVSPVVDGVFKMIFKALADGRPCEFRGFGALEIKIRKERVGRNPKNPTVDVVIPRHAVVKFKASRDLKAALAQMDLSKIA